MQALSPHRLSGMVAPWVVWALHFVTVYSLQGVVCAEDVLRHEMAGAEAATWLLVAIGIAAVAATIWLGLRGLHAWQRARREVQPDVRRRRERFAAAVAALSGLLSTVAIVFTTIPVLMLPPCA
ncbi:hypothetical protein CO641_13165 [Lysobacteraceae bacterium NML91-0213]|nr:hypothetical protein CO641_13165 [Xanthomonadaceae bacterium NML91-0213]